MLIFVIMVFLHQNYVCISKKYYFEIILGNPFIALLYQFVSEFEETGISNNILGQQIKFDFIMSKDVNIFFAKNY
jgi:hypothetical protein